MTSQLLEFPTLDVNSPFSILDKLSLTEKLKEGKTVPNNQAEDESDYYGLLSSTRSNQDEVLDRFTLSKGLGPFEFPIHNESEKIETYDPFNCVDDPSSSLSQWPRSVDELADTPMEEIDGNILHSQNWPELKTSRKLNSGVSYLIKPILPSDFDDHLDNFSDDDKSSISDFNDVKDMKHKAWPHHFQYSEALMPSLIAAAQGHSSEHFIWSNDLMAFNCQRRSIPTEKVEKYFNITETSAQSIEERFLIIGTLQRRMQWRIDNISSSDNVVSESASIPPELHTLASGLSEVLEIVKVKLNSFEGRLLEAGALEFWNAFASIEGVLQCLSQMIKCSMDYSPPFPPIIESTSSSITKRSAQLLTLIYAHLVAALNSCDQPEVIASLEYLLYLTTKNWRKDVANWIGWPCIEEDRSIDDIDVRMRMGSEERMAERDNQIQHMKSNRFEPWSGMEVEWSWDDRGELDVGYTLRPVRLPAFLPIATARDLLEAGRALRLLRRAAPDGHPLLTLHGHSSHDLRRYGLKLPDWYGDSNIQQVVRDLKREIAAWRRYRVQNGEMSMDKGMAYIGLPRTKHAPSVPTFNEPEKPFHANFSVENLQTALAQFNDVPGGETDFEEHDVLQSERTRTLRSFIEARRVRHMELDKFTIGQQTSTNLLSPMLHWSRLVNESLISVFFRDLHLGEYLDVCKDFLLLGNQSFANRIAEILFDDGSLGKTSVEGIGLSKLLLQDTTWPPGGSELPMALNAVVLENITTRRKLETTKDLTGHGRNAFEQGKLSRERGVEQALLDLDDRLSFAIVKPDKKSIAWHDRQSIEALEWLTISFQPPPLISPLITLQTQTSYQRLFRHLLRLMRVDSVLKSVFRRLMSRSQNALPDWMDEGDIECASRFRYEANHLVSVLYNHMTEMMVSHRWKIFRNRLDSLCRTAESQDDAMNDAVEQSSTLEETEDGMSFTDNMSELDGAMADSQFEENASETGTVGNDESTTKHHTELKDIFSIAAYHERTLDRMLNGCFLKARQSAIMSIILDLFNLILSFGQLILRSPKVKEEMDEPKMFSDVSRSSAINEGMEASRKLFNLLARLQSKVRLLLHALELVGQRAMNREGDIGKFGNLSLHRLRLTNASKRPEESFSSKSRSSNKKGTRANDARQAAIEAEIARQETEMRRDLEQLESTERKEGFGDLEELQALIMALRGK